jgi:hypothetical protein
MDGFPLTHKSGASSPASTHGVSAPEKTMTSKQQYETEVYATEDGYVAIAQPDPDEPGEDLFIYLTADQLPKVIQELQDLLSNRASWESGEAGSDG